MPRILYSFRDNIGWTTCLLKAIHCRIIQRLDALPSGSILVESNFADIADSGAVRQILIREADAGKLKRVLRGVYHKPKYNEILQEDIPASLDDIARAIARARRWTISPAGEAALNALGLSIQIPMTWVYVSDGSFTSYKVGNKEIRFKRTTNRDTLRSPPRCSS